MSLIHSNPQSHRDSFGHRDFGSKRFQVGDGSIVLVDVSIGDQLRKGIILLSRVFVVDVVRVVGGRRGSRRRWIIVVTVFFQAERLRDEDTEGRDLEHPRQSE